MNLVKIDMRPPNSKVVMSTTIRVELTMRLLFGDKDGLICKLRANAIAPLILPLNQIRINCFREMRISK
jgi:hypothetical protein